MQEKQIVSNPPGRNVVTGPGLRVGADMKSWELRMQARKHKMRYKIRVTKRKERERVEEADQRKRERDSKSFWNACGFLRRLKREAAGALTHACRAGQGRRKSPSREREKNIKNGWEEGAKGGQWVL